MIRPTKKMLIKRSLGVSSLTALLFVIVAVAVSTALFLSRDGKSSSVAEAQAFLDQIPDQLQVEPGKVVHIVTEGYIRYGPKREEIMRREPLPGTLAIMPEHWIAERWTEYISPQEYRQFRAIVEDLEGNIVQDNQPPVDAVDSGEAGGPVTAPKNRAAEFTRQLDEGTARVLRVADQEIVIESSRPYTETFPDTSEYDNAIAIPYVEDLSPTEWVTETAIRSDGQILYTHIFVITASDEKVLVESHENVLIETLERAPAGILYE